MTKDEVYIHLKKENWQKEKSTDIVTVGDVQSAFTAHKDRYAIGERIFGYEKTYKNMYNYILQAQQLDTSAFDGVYEDILIAMQEEFDKNLITKTKLGLSSKAITNLGYMSEAAIKRLLKAQGGSGKATIFQMLKDIKEKIEELKEMSLILKDEQGTLSMEDMDKIQIAEKSIQKTLDLEGKTNASLSEVIEQLKKTSHNIRTAWTGGFDEFFKNLALAIGQNAKEEILKSQNAITRVESVKENLGAEFSKGQKMKADNAVEITYKYDYGKTKGTAFIGISEKANKIKTYAWGSKKKAGRTALMGGTNYDRIFEQVDNKRVEKYFCNEAVFFKADFMNRPQNMVQKYITAKATSYALSGGDDEHLAYFLHTGDQLVYIPKLLERLATSTKARNNGIMRLSVAGLSALKKNTPKGNESAESRSNRIYSDIRSKAKFSMGIGSNSFWSLMGI